MPSLHNVIVHVRRYGFQHRELYLLSIMVLFWAVFDGIVGYISPLVITQSGLSKTLMGIIIGSSSIAGALFDFLLCKYLDNTHFRRVFTLMFAVCLVYPLILWQANTFVLYLIAMALWGLYYDLHNFGNFDYVSRYTKETEHSSSFGVLSVFQSLGYLVAPLLAGLLIGELVDWRPFVLSWIFIILALFFFVLLFILTRHKRDLIPHPKRTKPANLIVEFDLWKKIAKLCMPVLVLTMFLNITDSFFWTIGPLYAESFTSFHQFDGIFLTAYTLPTLFIGWFVGGITAKLGKKHTAYLSYLIGSAFLIFIPLTNNPFVVIAVIFVASACSAFAWPSINGAYADYIAEAPRVEKEIEGVEDFFTNIGYIIGPMLAGFFADYFGNAPTFAILGVCGSVAAIILLLKSPKNIIIDDSQYLKG